MHIRPLTDAELEQIREIKKKANEVLTKKRQALTKKIKKLPYGEAPDLVKELDRLQPITAKPVVIQLNGEALRLNYELFKKLYRSLEKRRWPCEVSIKRGQTGAILEVTYPAGIIELNELPAIQLELLGDLPVVDLKYGFDFLN